MIDGNYVVYHLHSDLSNGVTNIDSVTKYKEYIARASECGMTALGFAEHGSTFEWWHKKTDTEAAGMKFIYGCEVYLTSTLEDKIRDNYHCVLMARNYDGFLELNQLISDSFNRNDNHFYYVPRISFEEMFNTSDNIIFTTACVGGVFGKADEQTEKLFLDFMIKNKKRCFFEIGHHLDDKQVFYNKKIYALSLRTGIPLIAGTDTHALNEEHEKGRIILQASKDIKFDGEDKWDLKFKTYEELIEAYRKQRALDEKVYMRAIENTNVLADMIEEFTLDRGTKYPHIYENPEEAFREKIYNAIDNHPYALTNHTREELVATVEEEFEVYKKVGAIDFMLMECYLKEWEKEKGIQCGYGRGSVSGSMIAYLLGITQMDSLKHKLNFFRFLNPSRVTNADIDVDYADKDRELVKEFILKDKMNLENINSAEIITFNTIAIKGAVRDVCRALYKDNQQINYLELSAEINKIAERDEDKAREKYPEVFKYVDIVNGTIVSIGTHPSGVLISDLNIAQSVGLCTTSKSDYPVSMLNMKELDDLFYVKLDVLGLANIGCINEACKMAGIERFTPDNIDLNDMDVWKSIRDDTTLIFQWESDSSQAYLREFMSDKTLEIAKKRIPDFSMIKWLSFGNGLIRPGCASFRNDVAKGNFYDNGLNELNEFLAPEAGHIAMQETIMRFLVKFCGYSDAESDTVRRAIAKKKGTETLLPEIETRFIEYTSEHYNVSKEKCAETIKPFLQAILDASDYSFSWNHSDSYSMIGYICGYLRYYYPLQFLTAALNTFKDNEDKTAAITAYAGKQKILITPPKFGISKSDYNYDEETRTISKSLGSIKYFNDAVGIELYELSKSRHFESFIDVLLALKETSINSRQLEILIKIGFFSEFGNSKELMRIYNVFDLLKQGDSKKINKSNIGEGSIEIISKFATDKNKNGSESKFYTITDMYGLLRAFEEYIMGLGLSEIDLKTRIQNSIECLGYVDVTTNKPEDRRKLVIEDITPIGKGDPWCYRINTMSVGTGRKARLSVRTKLYKKSPIKKGDIIYVDDLFKNNAGYWEITKYHPVYC